MLADDELRERLRRLFPGADVTVWDNGAEVDLSNVTITVGYEELRKASHIIGVSIGALTIHSTEEIQAYSDVTPGSPAAFRLVFNRTKKGK